MYAAILAGGVGTRLWPRSRQAHPKQFADIVGSGRTMIQATVDRLEGLVPPERTWVITGELYADLARAQLPALPAAQIVAEPSGRNTAPAIGLACVHLRRTDPEAVLAVLPADHVITNGSAFRAALACAGEAAAAGALVTLGIEPTFPHTGYGYIKRSGLMESPTVHAHAAAAVPEDGSLPVYRVDRFLEKPDRATAEAFLHEGGYYWNGGIFVFRVDRMLEEIARQMPELARQLDLWDAADRAGDRQAAAAVWAQMPATSIDYGVMEGARTVAMVPLNAGWNDVGSWDALESVLESDEAHNFVARRNALAIDSFNNIVFADKQVVALIGVDDLVIVEDGDALLIGHKHQMQKVKEVVEALRKQGREGLV
jgi:mannose-1-phosphate guanylyltransferase